MKKYPKCQYIITCREAVYKKEFDIVCKGKFSIVEFSDSQISKYLDVYNKSKHIKTKALSKSLREKPALHNLAKNPLLLALISFTAIEQEKPLPHSRGGFLRTSN